MKFSCPHCGFDYELGAEYFGNHFNCSNCGRGVDVSAPTIQRAPVVINNTVFAGGTPRGGFGLIFILFSIFSIASPKGCLILFLAGVALAISGVVSGRGRTAGTIALILTIFPIIYFISIISQYGIAVLLKESL